MIGDWNNHRIQVLNLDLTFSHSFGSVGSANGEFHNPHNIAIDSEGLVYVVDTNNNCIQKFSPDGKFLDQFCWGSSGPGQLKVLSAEFYFHKPITVHLELYLFYCFIHFLLYIGQY